MSWSGRSRVPDRRVAGRGPWRRWAVERISGNNFAISAHEGAWIAGVMAVAVAANGDRRAPVLSVVLRMTDVQSDVKPRDYCERASVRHTSVEETDAHSAILKQYPSRRRK